jgi:hypothetical protein
MGGLYLFYYDDGGDMFEYHLYMYEKIAEDIAVIYFINTNQMFNTRVYNAAALLKEVLLFKAIQY